MAFCLRLAAYWTGFLLLWLLFVFQISQSELLFGAVASTMAVASGYVICRVVPACFEPRFRWVAQGIRLPVMVVQDLVPLTKALLRAIARQPMRSQFARARFVPTGNECEASAQRALAVLYVSVTPNSVVLDIDVEKCEMLFHQVEPGPVPAVLLKLQD